MTGSVAYWAKVEVVAVQSCVVMVAFLKQLSLPAVLLMMLLLLLLLLLLQAPPLRVLT
jgi:hypothetical protein